MDLKRPRKLNLNAPLLSTRRFGFSSVGTLADTSITSDDRVPFSWEQAPGKPKDTGTGTGDTPRPNKPIEEESNSDDQEEDHDDDVFSDAMDVFSLSEALDIVQRKTEKATHNHHNYNEELRLKIEEDSCNGYQSPTYMINRFLPDATALAASSALHFHSNNYNFGNRVCDTSYNCCSYSASSSSISQKGSCGLQILFPWRVMKHKLCCSMNTPVLPCSTNLQKHTSSSNNNSKSCSKQKKHHLPWSCKKSDAI